MERRTWLGIGVALCLVIASLAVATPPRLISYQGRVTDNVGTPVNQNGASVRFILYTDSTGGTIRWAEVTTKDIVDGLFSHVMGSLVALPDSLFINYDALFLEIMVNGEVNQPRTRLVSSPRTASLHGSAGGTITSDVLIQTISPGNGLEVNQLGLGRAGRFSTDNPFNTTEAMAAVTQGSGPAGAFLSEGSGPAVQATANGGGYSVYAQFGKGILSSIAGDSDSSAAVLGLVTSPSPGSYTAAVRGRNLGTGFTGIGVWGSQGGSGWGVYGTADGILSQGVRGSSASGTAIAGYTTSGISGAFNGGRVTILDATDASVGGAGTGYLVIGNTGADNIVADDNEIMARDNGATATLHVQANGGTLAVGHAVGTAPTGYALAVDGKTLMEGGTDVSLASLTSGYLIIGQSSGLNLAFDNNEIVARANGLDTILYLQSEGGAVAIGGQSLTMPDGYILVVDGKAIMEEVEVQLSNNWPDYVFEDGYELTPLDKLEELVKSQKHLPGVPPAAEVESEGLALGEMQSKLLEKIEELTLYVIELNKQVVGLRSEKQTLKSRIESLEAGKATEGKVSGL